MNEKASKTSLSVTSPLSSPLCVRSGKGDCTVSPRLKPRLWLRLRLWQTSIFVMWNRAQQTLKIQTVEVVIGVIVAIVVVAAAAVAAVVVIYLFILIYYHNYYLLLLRLWLLLLLIYVIVFAILLIVIRITIFITLILTLIIDK